MEKFEGSIEKLIEVIITKIPAIAVGLFILIVGRYVVRFALKFIESRFQKREVDPSISGFILSILKAVFYVLLILTVASTMGIQTTSFIAALSAFGLAVGMALQGSLSNFAGGVLILLFRPFEIGDYIESANGSVGTVDKIDLLYTTLTDDNGIKVFSPNGTLANSVIKNFTKITYRRIQYTIVLSYDANMKVARQTILNVLESDNRIQSKPAPTVFVNDLKDGGIELIIRAWSSREVYADTKAEIAEKLQESFDGQNVQFPQSSVKVLKDN